MNRFLPILIFSFVALFSSAQSDTAVHTKLSGWDKVNQAAEIIKGIFKKEAIQDAESQVSLDSLKRTMGDSEARLVILERRFKEMEQRDSTILNTQVTAASGILSSMLSGATYLKTVIRVTSVALRFSTLANPWSDKLFRSSFDRLKDYTPLFGIVGAGVPLLIKGSDPRIAIGTGIGSMFIPQLIALIAKPIVSKMSPKAVQGIATSFNKVQFLTQTRSAYDFLTQKQAEAKLLYIKDSTFLKDIETTRNSYVALKKPTEEETKAYVFKVKELYLQYSTICNEVPQIFASMLTYMNDPRNSAIFTDQDNNSMELKSEISSFLSGFQTDLTLIERYDANAKYVLFGMKP